MSAYNTIFIFLGPPGSGKGSLSSLCVKRLGWIQFSTGNLCREHIAHQTEIGKQIDFILKSGKLISDSLIIQMVGQWLHEQCKESKSIILDGFPRTVAQAQALKALLDTPKFESLRLSIVRMTIPDETVIARLSGRLICQNNKCQAVYSSHAYSPIKLEREMTCNECSSMLIRRADDEESAVRQRLALYYKHEQELLKFYESSGQKIDTINVTVPLEQVYNQLLERMQ